MKMRPIPPPTAFIQASIKELRDDLRSDINVIKAVGQRTEIMLGRMSALGRALGFFASIIAIDALLMLATLLGMLCSATGAGPWVAAGTASLQRDPGAAFFLPAGLILVAATVAIVLLAFSASPGWPAQPPQPPQQPLAPQQQTPQQPPAAVRP